MWWVLYVLFYQVDAICDRALITGERFADFVTFQAEWQPT
jgi:hypothetical protein